MKKRILTLLTGILLVVCLTGYGSCKVASGSSSDSNDNTDIPDDPVVPAVYSLFADSMFTWGSWDQLDAGLEADLAVGEWDQTVSVEVISGVAKLTLLAKADTSGWSGGTLAQLPGQAETGSYLDFSTVKYIKFKIKSADIAPSNVKFILQQKSGGDLIASVPLTTYGISSILDWTDVSIDVSAYSAQQISCAFALKLGTGAGKSAEVTGISFVNSAGANVDIAHSVTWAAAAVRTLVWSDEFDGTTNAPDAAIWGYDTVDTVGGGWGNNEVQTYTNARTNSYVSGGTLKICAVKDGSGNWTSARLVTKGKKDFTYGYVEFRAKIPAGAGTWPAIWMLPTSSTYGTVYWPDNGEIDIMEHATSTTGLNKVYGTVHRNAGSGGSGASAGTKTIATAASDFHTYAVEWRADAIVWYYDDVKLGEYDRSGGSGWQWWPFDKDFHIIMNVAVGGNLGGTISPALAGDILEIDYVRVYQ